MAGRFADVWTDAIDAEVAARERHRVERCYRGMLALTDELLGQLEQRNLRGQRELDATLRRDLARTLDELTPRARGRFPHTSVVQEALDGIFGVQEELMLVLQRMLHWDRLQSAAPWEAEEADDPLARRTA